ncbi:hypothetical protein BU23DRAFT_568043 [Bimuria novae-zelandiae CBS 107.79]|uniref:Uncharacterized protein n=1 Tax=Bimuria novae-zelandiae CBS 107.79 TaxID=1447943 RepID=A0A6A5VAB7_9PLEO|nr:hypothetical protein BU23DRAFT_568043 [Bimuria novae-zelandiae CBS 107.79]
MYSYSHPRMWINGHAWCSPKKLEYDICGNYASHEYLPIPQHLKEIRAKFCKEWMARLGEPKISNTTASTGQKRSREEDVESAEQGRLSKKQKPQEELDLYDDPIFQSEESSDEEYDEGEEEDGSAKNGGQEDGAKSQDRTTQARSDNKEKVGENAEKNQELGDDAANYD